MQQRMIRPGRCHRHGQRQVRHHASERVLVVGAGHAGFAALRTLDGRLPREIELVAVNENDYSLYASLLPEVAAGLVDPRHIAVPLGRHLHRTRTLIGAVTGIDVEARTADIVLRSGEPMALHWDRLVLNPGSITRTFGIPGVVEHARGFKTVSEALYLRDHLLALIERSAATPSSIVTVAVVGGGFAGVEFAGQAQLMLDDAARSTSSQIRAQVVVLNAGERLVPQFPPNLSRRLQRSLERRGVVVRPGARVVAVTDAGVVLGDGTTIASDAVVWAAGVEPNPLIATLGLPMIGGRLEVDESLRVPTAPRVFALGDAAAVPDVTHPGSWAAATAQHARRQGRTAALNVLASLGRGRMRRYAHHDFGFAVDLGGLAGAANPLGIPLTGIAARVAARSYHLYGLHDNRLRVLADWLSNGVSGRQVVSLGLTDPAAGVRTAGGRGLRDEPAASIRTSA